MRDFRSGEKTRIKKLNGKFGVIGRRRFNYNRWIIEAKYDHVSILGNLIVTTLRQNGKERQELWNEEGKLIYQNDCDSIRLLDAQIDTSYSPIEFALIEKAGEIEVLDKDGYKVFNEPVEEIEKKYVRDDRFYSKTYFWIKRDGKYGLTTLNGITVLPCEFEDISFGHTRNIEPVWFLKVKGQWGVRDNRFNEISPPIYEDLQCFVEGHIVAKSNQSSKWGLYKLGHAQPLFIFDEFYILTGDGYNKYHYGGVAILQNGKWGVLQYLFGVAGFKQTVECLYDSLRAHGEGLIVELNNKYGLVDGIGKLAVEIKYDRYELADFLVIRFYQEKNEFIFKGEKHEQEQILIKSSISSYEDWQSQK